MKHLLRDVLASICMIAAAGDAVAHDSAYTGLRHGHDLAAALETARTEARFVLAHLQTDERDTLRALRWPDATSASFVDAVVRETVLCELAPSAKADAFAERTGARAGQVLLLKPTGEVVARLDGSLDAAGLVVAIEGHLFSEEAVTAITAHLDGAGAKDPVSGARRAALLARSGRLAGAAELLAARVRSTVGPNAQADPVLFARRGIELAALARLASLDEAARRTLEGLLTTITRALENTRSGDARLARDFGSLCHGLGRIEAVADLFQRIDVRNRARHGLLDAAFDELLARGDYVSIAEIAHPRRAFEGELRALRRARITRPGLALHGKGRGSLGFTVARGIGYAEVLAALGDREGARALTTELLRLAPGEGTRSTLIQRIGRAGADDPAALVPSTKTTDR